MIRNSCLADHSVGAQMIGKKKKWTMNDKPFRPREPITIPALAGKSHTAHGLNSNYVHRSRYLEPIPLRSGARYLHELKHICDGF